MHIPPFDNANSPIVDTNDSMTPLVYFNRVLLNAGDTFESHVAGYETCIVPATGSVDIQIEDFSATGVGERGSDVWDGEPSGVYAPVGARVQIKATTKTEVFIAGAKFDEVYKPFAIRQNNIDLVQYG
ncbi:MAG: 5-deoxy-glucuronate isomerase, partial [Paracoccaceae bacterium]